jgi:hypothetical protein
LHNQWFSYLFLKLSWWKIQSVLCISAILIWLFCIRKYCFSALKRYFCNFQILRKYIHSVNRDLPVVSWSPLYPLYLSHRIENAKYWEVGIDCFLIELNLSVKCCYIDNGLYYKWGRIASVFQILYLRKYVVCCISIIFHLIVYWLKNP